MNYKSQNNTFLAIPKNDIKDRIEVEIGDSKQPDKFYPQLKIMRWDNEVNCSIRLKEDITELTENPTIIADAGKIKHVKKKRECHFYELSVSADLPEGASELEIILKEKPNTNKIEFTIQHKGLEFFYQPALTPEEIARGDGMPENVVGSYAVYYKDCPANYLDGKLYRCGKFGHIYRPKIVDSAGNWAWGSLNIDMKKGILTVTIPQDFLDNAIYPVRHAAGLTFGYTSNGASYTLAGTGNVWGSLFTGAAGTGVSMSVYIGEYDEQNYKLGIYGHATDLITNGATEQGTTVNDNAVLWLTRNFVSAPTLEAVEYIVCGYWAGSNSIRLRRDTGDANQGHQVSGTYDTWPTSPSWAHGTQKFSIYVTYTSTTDWTQACTETLSLSDVLLKGSSRIFNETLVFVTTLINKASKTLTEVITLLDILVSEILGKVITEAVTLTDDIFKSISRYLSDIINPIDTITATRTLPKTLEDVLNLTDNIIKTASRNLTEAVTLTDTILKQAGKIFSDTINLTDSYTKQLTKVATLSEIITLTATIRSILHGVVVGIWTRASRVKDVWNRSSRVSDSYNKSPRVKDDWNKTNREL